MYHTYSEISTPVRAYWGNLFYKKVRKIYNLEQKVLFNITMIGIIIITVAISIYYSYCNDFQPQGRYCLPMWIPLAILVTMGIGGVIKLFPKKIQISLLLAICVIYFVVTIGTTFVTIIPTYYS